MLTPEYIDHAPDELVELYRQAEDDILRDMAKRINNADLYIPSTQWQERKLQAMGLTHQEIVRRLAALTRKTNAEIEAIISDAGAQALSLDADVIQTYKGISSAPWVKTLIATGITRTQGTFKNLTLTTAKTATAQFERVLDRTYMQVSTGAFAQDKAILMAVKDLCARGIEAITYPTGHRDYIDVAVRRAVITGLNQTAGEVSDRLAKELDYDLVEVSAHAGARPSHAEWQGKVYSRKGKTDKYDDFYAATGYGTGAGLCGWNCRHSFSAYQEGQARAYTPEMLAKFEAKDYSYNGKAMTEYEATQKQRYIERQIRRYKREAMATRDIGQDAEAAEAKVHEWQKRLTDFCRQTGLKRVSPARLCRGMGAINTALFLCTKSRKGFGYITRKRADEHYTDYRADGLKTEKGEKMAEENNQNQQQNQPNAEQIANSIVAAIEARSKRTENGIVKSYAEQYGMTEAEITQILDSAKKQKAAQPTPEQQAAMDKRLDMANGRLISAEIKAVGGNLGLLDADAASALMDKSKVKVKDDGTVEGVKEALEALKKHKPYLFNAAPQRTGMRQNGTEGKEPPHAAANAALRALFMKGE